LHLVVSAMNLATFTNKVEGIISSGLAGLWYETNPPSPSSERRAYTRMKVQFKGSVDFEGQRLRVRGIDLHRAGARLSSDRRLPLGARVFFYAKSHGLMGWAIVRWCSWGQSNYQVGLEFRHPLMRAEAGSWQFCSVELCQGSEHASMDVPVSSEKN